MEIDEIITGNLSKYAALPPDYFGQPKKGHLVFDACFESGKWEAIYIYLMSLWHMLGFRFH